MDVAADRKSSRIRKGDVQRLARRLFRRVIGEAGAVDIDLMQELVLIAEIQRGAGRNRDLGGMERAAVLHDRVRVVGERSRANEQRDGRDRPHRGRVAAHFVTMSCCIGAKRARKRFWVANPMPSLSIAFCRSSTTALKSALVRCRPLCVSFIVRPVYLQSPPATWQNCSASRTLNRSMLVLSNVSLMRGAARKLSAVS